MHRGIKVFWVFGMAQAAIFACILPRLLGMLGVAIALATGVLWALLLFWEERWLCRLDQVLEGLMLALPRFEQDSLLALEKASSPYTGCSSELQMDLRGVAIEHLRSGGLVDPKGYKLTSTGKQCVAALKRGRHV